MKRYWDYSEQGRAGMSSETVESLLKAELMEAGVEDVKPIELEAIPDVTVAKKVAWKVGYDSKYGSKSHFDCVFETQDQALAFVALKPQHSEYDYNIGSNYIYPVAVSGLCVEQAEMFDHASVLTVTPQLQQIAAIKKRNEELSNDFREKSKAISNVCDGVWENWHDCGSKKLDVERIQDTYREYLGICDGNADAAMKFLRKTFGDERVNRAIEWLGDNIGIDGEQQND